MALDYTLHLDAELSPVALLRSACRSLGLAPTLRDEPLVSHAAPDMILTAMRTGASRHSILEEELGIRPRIDLSFRLDKERRFEARRRMLQVCSDALGTLAGDAALLFDGEYVLLLRRAGRLVIHTDLSDDDAAMITLPCERAVIPSL